MSLSFQFEITCLIKTSNQLFDKKRAIIKEIQNEIETLLKVVESQC